jgi:hypothetical protein
MRFITIGAGEQRVSWATALSVCATAASREVDMVSRRGRADQRSHFRTDR